MSHAVSSERLDGEEAWTLSGPRGACVVIPAAGSQLCSLRLAPGAGREPVEVLLAPGPGGLRQAGWGAGAPILFPFPGRVGRGEYPYRGTRHRIAPGGVRHPLHGFVGLRPWEVVDAGTDARGAYATTAIEHAALGIPAEAFPGAYRLEVTHRVGPDGYAHEIAVRNVGTAAFPFGYGWHPYFRAPLGPRGSRAECVLRVPAAARWELTADLLPTGRRLEVGGPYDLRAPSPLGDKSFDDPFTLLERDADGWSRAELTDPAAGLRLEISADASFGHLVVYSPRTSGSVCLEPYTCAPDAYNLEARGMPAGLRELEPGEGWAGAIRVTLGDYAGGRF
jgi:aldose 1-epimerase